MDERTMASGEKILQKPHYYSVSQDFSCGWRRKISNLLNPLWRRISGKADMLKRINAILLLSGFILFLAGCSASKIPVSYRYTPRQLKKDITGNWTEVRLNSKDITGSESVLSGELIAIQSDTIYVLTEHGLKGVHTSEMKEAILYMFMDQSGEVCSNNRIIISP